APPATVAPYTTLFRSGSGAVGAGVAGAGVAGAGADDGEEPCAAFALDDSSAGSAVAGSVDSGAVGDSLGACGAEWAPPATSVFRSEEHTSELQSRFDL